MNKEAENIVSLAHELQAIAAGLTYSKETFDIERYERIRDIATELICLVSDEPLEKVKHIFETDADYQTPKISTRAAIFNDRDEVLLVRDFDGKWVLPGGWCDYNQTIMSNTVKEVLEEAGLEVEPYRLVGIFEIRIDRIRSHIFMPRMPLYYAGLSVVNSMRTMKPQRVNTLAWIICRN